MADTSTRFPGGGWPGPNRRFDISPIWKQVSFSDGDATAFTPLHKNATEDTLLREFARADITNSEEAWSDVRETYSGFGLNPAVIL